MFSDIVTLLDELRSMDFTTASERLIAYVDNDSDFLDTLRQIGTIPESIEHDSTAEKLFSKASDAVLARAFREIGLKSCVLVERGDSADVLAESRLHGYTVVSDAKAFRMSRTAKNQKDFKIAALSGWRKSYDYAVLCSPYFQYPPNRSQIYAQALEYNVCPLSWEHLIFLISNGVKETKSLNLSAVWNCSAELAKHVVVADRKKNFINQIDSQIISCSSLDQDAFYRGLKEQIIAITDRADIEKKYLYKEIASIRALTHEQAIEELLKAKKVNERLAQIDTYVEGLTI